jgi:uncharacterized membrane protein YqjE
MPFRGNNVEAIPQNDNHSSLAATVGKIVDDTHQLVRQEFELAKTEIKQEVKHAAKAALGVTLGAVCAAFGVVLLTVSLVALLTRAGLPFWLSCFAFAVLYFGAAFAAYSWSKKEAKEIGPNSRRAELEGLVLTEAETFEDPQQENVRWLKNRT